MRSSVKLLLPALAASLTLAACGSSTGGSGYSSQGGTTSTNATPSSGGEGGAVVRSAPNATLGATVLVNAGGMTLYSLSAERNGRFICTTSACLNVWHPLSASGGAPSGSVGSLGTVRRPDGTEQVTYTGMALYTFAGDQRPGDAKGQGIRDVGSWAAVTVGSGSSSGASVSSTTATTAAPTTTTTSSGGGSGY